MSAKRLRDAARLERSEWSGPVNGRLYPRPAAIHLALADWLDRVAIDGDNGYDAGDDNYARALVVADAILGGTS